MKKAAVFLAGALCAALIGLELVCRMIGFAHPLLYQASPAGYEVQPSQDLSIFFNKVTYNSMGLRGADVPPVPAAGRNRILALGDSMTFGGLQLSDEETYPELYQALLTDTDVLNASAGGWALQNAAKWLEEHGLLGSHALILQINESDLAQGFVSSAVIEQYASFPTRGPVLATQEVFRRVWHRLKQKFARRSSADPGAHEESVIDPENVEGSLAAVESIYRIVEKEGARMGILYLDVHAPSARAQIVSARTALFDWAKARGVPVIRVRLDLEQAAGRQVLRRDGIHPNGEGNRIIARALKESFPDDGAASLPVR